MKYGTTTGTLKPLDEISLFDPRIEHEPYRPESNASLSLGDMHERLQKYSSLHAGVPERVKIQFDVARNLMLYACHVFEFQTQAELQAYAALEFALRKRFGDPTRQVTRGKETMLVPVMLKELLQRAVSENLIDPKKLPSFDWTNRLREYRARQEGYDFEPISANEWLSLVVTHIASQRNHIAHGNPRLDLPFSFNQIERCADIINAIFPMGHQSDIIQKTPLVF